MKICLFCAEEINDQAVKCKFCGEWIDNPNIALQVPFHLKFQIYMEDIRHAKNQQWLVAYYSLLLQSGLIAFRNLFHSSFGDLIIGISSVSISIIGIIFIWIYFTNILGYREKAKPDDQKNCSFLDVVLPFLLSLVVFMPFIIILLFLLSR